nr:uncharacterized protein LOC117688478 [Crassostrea gigas]
MTTRCDDSQTPSFGLTIIEVPAEELSNSSKVSNQSSSDYVSVSQRPISPATGCSNATLPVMTDTTSCKRNSTDKSKQEKAKAKKKSAEDVYALQCAVLEKELEKNNLQIELLNILLTHVERQREKRNSLLLICFLRCYIIDSDWFSSMLIEIGLSSYNSVYTFN